MEETEETKHADGLALGLKLRRSWTHIRGLWNKTGGQPVKGAKSHRGSLMLRRSAQKQNLRGPLQLSCVMVQTGNNELEQLTHKWAKENVWHNHWSQRQL